MDLEVFRFLFVAAPPCVWPYAVRRGRSVVVGLRRRPRCVIRGLARRSSPSRPRTTAHAARRQSVGMRPMRLAASCYRRLAGPLVAGGLGIGLGALAAVDRSPAAAAAGSSHGSCHGSSVPSEVVLVVDVGSSSVRCSAWDTKACAVLCPQSPDMPRAIFWRATGRTHPIFWQATGRTHPAHPAPARPAHPAHRAADRHRRSGAGDVLP